MMITVIVSTYNSEAWLEKVLLGYAQQTYPDFEVIIADDGHDRPRKHWWKDTRWISPCPSPSLA